MFFSLLIVSFKARFPRHRITRQQHPPQYTSSYSTNERLVCHVRQIETPGWDLLHLCLGSVLDAGKIDFAFLRMQWKGGLIARVHKFKPTPYHQDNPQHLLMVPDSEPCALHSSVLICPEIARSANQRSSARGVPLREVDNRSHVPPGTSSELKVRST